MVIDTNPSLRPSEIGIWMDWISVDPKMTQTQNLRSDGIEQLFGTRTE